ncbi:MAG: hypothetical protein LBB93_01205 [Elusimicrobiota bacterium]|jgi:hypothetical protein|nr:hypothetical protein [Elusimicrobiota bacterium]
MCLYFLMSVLMGDECAVSEFGGMGLVFDRNKALCITSNTAPYSGGGEHLYFAAADFVVISTKIFEDEK